MELGSDFMSTSNLICFTHPHYHGESSPDLTCKVCCSLFVAKIRDEQRLETEKVNLAKNQADQRGFRPMSDAQVGKDQAKPAKSGNFDGSWI
jgi:hypothetical protein